MPAVEDRVATFDIVIAAVIIALLARDGLSAAKWTRAQLVYGISHDWGSEGWASAVGKEPVSISERMRRALSLIGISTWRA